MAFGLTYNYKVKQNLAVASSSNGELTMLTKYLEAAMRHARYEVLKDDGTYYGEISKCRGVYANARTLEQCRTELAEVLEDWLLFRIHRHLSLPTIDGIHLSVKKEKAA